ncbi:hypothetical protein [Saccharopolyspora spinosa]|uniref:hypothetical protein n=1 Tax=Saccharopolyspora spinosa TaxID=60894 RepID=UPI000237B1D1|nr:hypothetical protein [Saccharopolyspora spinosa]
MGIRLKSNSAQTAVDAGTAVSCQLPGHALAQPEKVRNSSDRPPTSPVAAGLVRKQHLLDFERRNTAGTHAALDF